MFLAPAATCFQYPNARVCIRVHVVPHRTSIHWKLSSPFGELSQSFDWETLLNSSTAFWQFRWPFWPSECVARVPVSLWGSGGWGCVRSTLRLWSQPSNRPQPFATVRNRPREDRMAVPMGSSAEVVLFGGFRRVVASFRVAGVALRDIQTCSGTCRKSFCVAGAILLRRFQKMCCSFRGRRSTLDVSIVIFRGRRSTLDVSCCVFFANRIGRAASSGDKVQIPWQAWHFVTMCWKLTEASHETSILRLQIFRF